MDNHLNLTQLDDGKPRNDKQIASQNSVLIVYQMYRFLYSNIIHQMGIKISAYSVRSESVLSICRLIGAVAIHRAPSGD